VWIMVIESPNKGHSERGSYLDFEETGTDGKAQT